jgi:hypothetical protein
MTKDDALRMMLGPFKAWRDVPGNEDVVEELTKIINAVEKVLAQPEQEPVAWLCTPNEDGLFGLPLSDKGCKDCFPVYRHPPQRTWVGLTDEEAKEVWKQLNYDFNHGKFAADDTERHVIVEFYRAIEAKLREKNT